MTPDAENHVPRYRIVPLTEDDIEAIARERAQHRATGCRLFDDKFAKCTCPIPPGCTPLFTGESYCALNHKDVTLERPTGGAQQD